MVVNIKNVTLECIKGDITKQVGFDAIVNAANAFLAPGGGVAGAIHKAAGPLLYQECKNLAPIKVGEAVITKAYNLPNKYIIHCLGPKYGIDKPEDKLLASCYKNALALAEKNKVTSIAFPAISTGAFGYPIEEAAKVSLQALIEVANQLREVKRIRLVLYSESDLKVYQNILKKLTNELKDGDKNRCSS
ncbi:MAG: RNase III inhibitor [Candidatus Omnitrophota bacterium]|nr:MAG: RNase III inhibitor [Candidatus Omnitrophota bacterium]RKY39150.1 MAG: RNase III inhibitor [Candidatus Omnitrophota bacterium]RKY45813.1 MAG: RNase III inhibitor [Candidatus Omnitrophota bacterium]